VANGSNRRTRPPSPAPPPVQRLLLPNPAQPHALGELRTALLARQGFPEPGKQAIEQILRYSARTLENYHLARVAEWSQARYALDKRFTRLTLLVDQGPEAQGTRWQAQQNTFDDLHEVLAGLADPDPLPEAPTTGREETFVLAAAMAVTPADFIDALLAVNLPLAWPLRRAARHQPSCSSARPPAAGPARP
jgi:hypothetical protein